MKLQSSVLVALVLFGASSAITSFSQSSVVTYQGRLDAGGSPANGVYDLQFDLMSAASGSASLGSAQTIEDVPVTNGLFTVQINPDAAAFDGSDRWIELRVRPGTNTGAFTTLAPRQQITSTPYAIRAANVDAAGVSGVIPDAALGGNYGSPVTFGNAANVFSGTFYGNYYGLSFVGGSFSGAFIGNGSGLGFLNASQLLGGTVPSAALNNSWRTLGNAGTIPGTHFIGTTDNKPLEFRINNQRVMSISTNANGSPNIVAGSPANSILPGVEGSTISGGGIGAYPNTVNASYATIGGGTFHIVSGAWSTIAGGRDNIILGGNSTIGGGWRNHIWPAASYSTIAGGVFNTIGTNGYYDVIGGGYFNTIEQDSSASTISGGFNNSIGNISDNAVIGGGSGNRISPGADYATIPGGVSNVIGTNSNYSVIGGGDANRISDNAEHATIPGGFDNSATNFAFASGLRARAVHTGAFVWADSQGDIFNSTTNNEVSFRAQGGVRFASGSGGANQTVSWTPGSASWSFTSDRNTKENLAPVDSMGVLEKLSALPLHEWSYIGHPQRHIGPMAQDFHAAFPLNDSDTTLNSADLQGVTLAAIQGLNQKLTDELKRRDAENAELKQRLEKLEHRINTKNQGEK